MKFQQRSADEQSDPKAGWGRRATDNSLRGLIVDEADSDEAWESWQDALKQQEGEPTQPAPLE